MPNITFDASKLSPEEAAVIIGILGMRKAVVENTTPEKKAWRPKDGEEYYCLEELGNCSRAVWNTDQLDSSMYSIGNCFKSKEDAEFAAEKLKVIAELGRFAEENNDNPIDWRNMRQIKHTLIYNYNSEKPIQTVSAFYWQCGGSIYFTSEEIAEAAVKTIGEDRIIKYYFGIKE